MISNPVNDDYTIVVKCVLVPSSVMGFGRTSLLMRCAQNYQGDPSNGSLGIEFQRRVVTVPSNNSVDSEGSTVTKALMMWDTTCSERYNSLSVAYLRSSHAILMCVPAPDIFADYTQMLRVRNSHPANSQQQRRFSRGCRDYHLERINECLVDLNRKYSDGGPLNSETRPHLFFIVTKSDLIDGDHAAQLYVEDTVRELECKWRQHFPHTHIFITSAKEGAGTEELVAELAKLNGMPRFNRNNNRVVTLTTPEDPIQPSICMC